jgi:hypothetical protein
MRTFPVCRSLAYALAFCGGGLVSGTEFMDRLRFWLQAVPGEQCVRAGAGAYADAILPSTWLARAGALRAAICGALKEGEGCSYVQTTRPTWWRPPTSARTTPSFRPRPSTLAVCACYGTSVLVCVYGCVPAWLTGAVAWVWPAYTAALRVCDSIEEQNPGITCFPYTIFYVYFEQYLNIIAVMVGVLALAAGTDTTAPDAPCAVTRCISHSLPHKHTYNQTRSLSPSLVVTDGLRLCL